MSDVLEEAQRLYNESLDAMNTQRIQIEEDLKFSDPSEPDQWEADIKQQRENDPGGKRPCLVMDQCGQYVSNVAGSVEKSPPALHAIPVRGGADKLVAEQIDGRFRHIEYMSRASQHYTTALLSAARVGVGYLIVRPEYVDRQLGWQEPRINSEMNSLAVVFDPWSVDKDGKDATFAFLVKPVSHREFEKRWGKADKRDFGDMESATDERKSVLLGEQWIAEEKNVSMILHLDAQGKQAESTEEEYWAASKAAGVTLPVLRSYKDKQTVIAWRLMSGERVLKETVYPADMIGVVPMYGYIGMTDGRMRYCGIPRRARAPQQAYNYHISEQLAFIGTAPKSPWLVSKRASKGVEDLWDRTSIDARGWVPWTDFDQNGAVTPPTRINPSTVLVNHESAAAQALRDIQASIGMYQANIGARSNVISGVAYDAQKEQGEASTAHFPSHMAASIGQVGLLVMQMDAKLTDTRRTQPTIGVDGSPGSVNVDPEQQVAAKTGPNGLSINPNIGTYGVRIVVGASYVTQRKETNAAFGEIMRGNKELAPVVAPFWAQTLDFPGADKFAQAMAAMAPAPVKAILQPNDGKNAPDPAQLAAELEQCKQALQEAIQHAKDAQDDADKAMQEAASSRLKLDSKERSDEINEYKAETDRLKVTGANEEQIQAITRDLINDMLTEESILPGDGKNPSNAAPVEQVASVEPEVPAEQVPPAPAQPSPEILELLQSQMTVNDSLVKMMEQVVRPKKRIPVRDKAGNITEVIEQ